MAFLMLTSVQMATPGMNNYIIFINNNYSSASAVKMAPSHLDCPHQHSVAVSSGSCGSKSEPLSFVFSCESRQMCRKLSG